MKVPAWAKIILASLVITGIAVAVSPLPAHIPIAVFSVFITGLVLFVVYWGREKQGEDVELERLTLQDRPDLLEKLKKKRSTREMLAISMGEDPRKTQTMNAVGNPRDSNDM